MKHGTFVKGSFKELNKFEKLHSAPDGAQLTIAASSDPALLRGPAIPFRKSGVGQSRYRKHGKRVLDITFVLMTLSITLPVTLVCALALWLEGGQPFYRQKRLGANGKTFSILKLRTMGTNAEQELKNLLAKDEALREEWETTQKLKNDPRITRVGAFLRSTSLDELPQFLNVLKGEMSVVGPRPMMPDQLPLYPDPSSYFALRPGITGAWQVSDRNENSFAHRATIDTGYDSSLSFLEDLKIIAKTVGVVLRRTGY
ncbi:sugar transferase [Roseovarius sp. A21]|uniref:Sugar transferase n=1 Tax=Roseovarius bejariae TaxID=2576383 RepID=A0A844CRM9_9RHOB|nr:sugar transferase [Roseovarius bejariae]MRU16105.1 sugar transferase [Roseovarius bejariae]